MRSRKIIQVICVLLLCLVAGVALLSINHPIILKWVTGSARHFGRPIPAKVFLNGRTDGRINIFYSDEPGHYLLSLEGFEKRGKMQILDINLIEQSVGTTTGITTNDYDVIGGHLFLANRAQRFAPIQKAGVGNSNDPQVFAGNKQIRFNIPGSEVMVDSVRIELP